MQHELLGSLNQHVVDLLFVHFRAERYGRQRLRFAAGEDRRAVGCGQVAHLAPDRADLVGTTAVETNSLVEDHVAHRLFQHVVVEIPLDQHFLLGELFFAETSLELGFQRVETVHSLVLGGHGLGDLVSLVVSSLDYLTTQLLVVGLMAVNALDILAELLAQFDLSGAVFLDLLVGELDRIEHHGLGNLFHLAFDHQDIVDRRPDHDVEIGIDVLREGRIDHELAVDAGHPHLGNRAAERHVRHGQRRRRGQAGQRVGHNILVGRNQIDRHENLGMEIRGKQRTQSAVDQTRHENLVVRRTGLAFEEAAREASAGSVFLLVLDRQRHEVAVVLGFFGGGHRGEQHRVALLHDDRTVGLLGQFSGFDDYLAVPAQWNHLSCCVVIHYFNSLSVLLLR